MDPFVPENLAEQLSAYLDDELSAEERRAVDARLAESPAAARLLEELRALKRGVAALPRAAAPDSLRAALRAHATTATPPAAQRVPRITRVRPWVALFAAAASIGLVWFSFQRIEELSRRPAPRDPADAAAPLPEPITLGVPLTQQPAPFGGGGAPANKPLSDHVSAVDEKADAVALSLKKSVVPDPDDASSLTAGRAGAATEVRKLELAIATAPVDTSTFGLPVARYRFDISAEVPVLTIETGDLEQYKRLTQIVTETQQRPVAAAEGRGDRAEAATLERVRSEAAADASRGAGVLAARVLEIELPAAHAHDVLLAFLGEAASAGASGFSATAPASVARGQLGRSEEDQTERAKEINQLPEAPGSGGAPAAGGKAVTGSIADKRPLPAPTTAPSADDALREFLSDMFRARSLREPAQVRALQTTTQPAVATRLRLRIVPPLPTSSPVSASQPSPP